MVEYGIAARNALGQGGGYGASSSLDQWVALLSSPTALVVAAGAALLVVWALR